MMHINEDFFRKAFLSIDQGLSFVFICELMRNEM